MKIIDCFIRNYNSCIHFRTKIFIRLYMFNGIFLMIHEKSFAFLGTRRRHHRDSLFFFYNSLFHMRSAILLWLKLSMRLPISSGVP